MILRPGPASIDPGTVPGGVVVHMYNLAGELLDIARLDPDAPDADVDVIAERARLAADTGAPNAGGVVMVAYDGDTGARWSPLDWLEAISE